MKSMVFLKHFSSSRFMDFMDGQRSVITYIYMLRITYTYVMCLNVINVHNVFAR